jgi:hypothetical protein
VLTVTVNSQNYFFHCEGVAFAAREDAEAGAELVGAGNGLGGQSIPYAFISPPSSSLKESSNGLMLSNLKLLQKCLREALNLLVAVIENSITVSFLHSSIT